MLCRFFNLARSCVFRLDNVLYHSGRFCWVNVIRINLLKIVINYSMDLGIF
jgi:hypothetical protein